ncbi:MULTISPECIES: hypothetical protein [unclassified Streptomyces]|uniref:hypothetical protein n=1 Tax=unclassified Streptomyces TaxID=2593676 RepID=UPI00131AD16D|nr:hypothetical protein [Streptomyces sp. CB01635]
MRTLVAHPGIVATNLAGHSASGKVARVLGFLFIDAEFGALPSLYTATQNIPGNAYVGPNGPGSLKGRPKLRKPAAAALDLETAMRCEP